MKTLLRFSLLLVCLLGVTCIAQNQVLASGRVLNETTGEPIPGLTVFLLDDLGQRLPPEANEQNVTTLEGEFTISDVLPDAWYTIEVYSGKSLVFTDYISTATDENVLSTNDEGLEVLTLPDINLRLENQYQ